MVSKILQYWQVEPVKSNDDHFLMNSFSDVSSHPNKTLKQKVKKGYGYCLDKSNITEELGLLKVMSTIFMRFVQQIYSISSSRHLPATNHVKRPNKLGHLYFIRVKIHESEHDSNFLLGQTRFK